MNEKVREQLGSMELGEMAWMVVHAEINFRRKGTVYSFNAKPKPIPQQFPRDFVDYAVEMGFADEVPSPNQAEARAIKGASSKAKTKGSTPAPWTDADTTQDSASEGE